MTSDNLTVIIGNLIDDVGDLTVIIGNLIDDIGNLTVIIGNLIDDIGQSHRCHRNRVVAFPFRERWEGTRDYGFGSFQISGSTWTTCFVLAFRTVNVHL